MIKRFLIGTALVLVGFGFGQAFAPAKAAAGSVDDIVRELRYIRSAVQSISRSCENF